MNYLKMSGIDVTVPQVALGCMRIAGVDPARIARLIGTAVECGVTFFDHADIYGAGASEEAFAAAYTGRREDIFIQTKCAIRPGVCYDFSKAHIVGSVEASLRRLKTDYVDFLLLHRPDALAEPEEVAAAFDELQSSGKVRWFGVSNHNPAQIELLTRYVKQPLLFNQLQFGIGHTEMIDAGINVNMHNDAGLCRDGSLIDYCRLHDIRIQAWAPFQYGFFEGFIFDRDKFPELNDILDRIGEREGVTPAAVAVAWISRHPAGIQTIVGTTDPDRLRGISKSSQFELTREEWYEIYRAAGHQLP